MSAPTITRTGTTCTASAVINRLGAVEIEIDLGDVAATHPLLAVTAFRAATGLRFGAATTGILEIGEADLLATHLDNGSCAEVVRVAVEEIEAAIRDADAIEAGEE